MAYGKKNKKSNPFIVVKIKLARMLVYSFPLNGVRVWGLRICGFNVGKNVYIGSGLVLTMSNSNSKCDLVIGDRVAIAPRVTLILASDANWSRLNEIIPPIQGKIVLKDDCWLGAGVIILPNITIGEMSVVGAGSVVSKDVPPFTMVAGTPAMEIKKIVT
jgi:acetyltransferase-like isoleucine patch superfamily enzyme